MKVKEYTCIKKYKDTQQRIVSYKLQSSSGETMIIDTEDLVERLLNKEFTVDNLRVTLDNKIVGAGKDRFEPFRERDGTLMSYDILLIRSMQPFGFDFQDHIYYRRLNVEYLNIVDGTNKRIGFIPTKYMEDTIAEIEKSYNLIEITENIRNAFDEAYYTCAIEGANININEASQLLNSETKSHDAKMIQNSYRAINYLDLVRQKEMLSEKELLKAWKIITKDVCDNEDIKGEKYRSGDVKVGMHEAPSFEKLDELMACYFKFMNTENRINIYIKAAILHFYFVFIHPFCDGNGRMTRLVSTDSLIRSGLDKFKNISLSREIHRTLDKYRKALQDSENIHNDITPFIEYYLGVVKNTLKMYNTFCKLDNSNIKI